MEESPLLLDRYRVIRRLGSGAFATVYLADDTVMGRSVAVKVVDDDVDRDGRALREAQAAAKLDHRHIVTVFEVASEPEHTLLFTEYVEGHTLRELYKRRRLTDRRLLDAGIQIASALEHAHKRGVIHRDIKPENVMLVDGDEIDVRVMDFGVAKLEDLSSVTIDGDLVGTLAYMSPEQLRAESVDAKADVYSLSLTLYEGFTGSNPLRGKNPGELLKGPSRMVFTHLERLRPDLPAVLAQGLQAGLDKDPAKRPDAKELRIMLEQAARELPEPEETPTLSDRATEALSAAVRNERLLFFGRHAVAGASALVACAYVLASMPFYPENAVLPLVAVCAFMALLTPTFGGILALVVIAPPIFDSGLGWGVMYVLTAGVSFGLLRWRRKEWVALLPGAAPAMVGVGVGLAFPALAGLLARRWGPLLGGLAGLSIAFAGAAGTWDALPYTYTTVPVEWAAGARHAATPLAAINETARLFDLRPELLLQVGLFAAFSVSWGLFLKGTVPLRLWTATLYLGSMFTLLVVLPPLLVGAGVDEGALLQAFWPCVIIVYLIALLTPVGEPTAAPEGS
jgi:hypothetical protein